MPFKLKGIFYENAEAGSRARRFHRIVQHRLIKGPDCRKANRFLEFNHNYIYKNVLI